jgi:hypothetical protein
VPRHERVEFAVGPSSGELLSLAVASVARIDQVRPPPSDPAKSEFLACDCLRANCALDAIVVDVEPAVVKESARTWARRLRDHRQTNARAGAEADVALKPATSSGCAVIKGMLFLLVRRGGTVTSISALLAQLSGRRPGIRRHLAAGLSHFRSGSSRTLDDALLPLLQDQHAITELRTFLHRHGAAHTSVSRLSDYEVLRQAAVLLSREPPMRAPASAAEAVSAVRYADADDRSFDRAQAIRFSAAEAMAFLNNALKADRVGLTAVLKQVSIHSSSGAKPGRGAETVDTADTAVPQLAALLHRGELAVAPARNDDRVFYFFRPQRQVMVLPKAEPASEAPKPRRVTSAPPPVTVPEFPPLPSPSGAAPATCACMRNAAMAGVPFVAT